MPNRTRAALATVLLSACFAYATTSSAATRSVIPISGSSSSNVTSPQSSCVGNLWSCIDDPIGYPDADTSYVYTTSSSASQVVGFSSSYSQITSVMLHVVAASYNGGSGSVTLSFYNGSQWVSGSQQQISANSAYKEYASGIFSASVANLGDIQMKIALTGSVKYTAAWMDITYGNSGTASGNLVGLMGGSNGPWFAGSCVDPACTGGAENATLSISPNVTVPSGGPYSTGTKVVASTTGTMTGHTDSALEWVKLNQNSQNPSLPSSLVSLTGDWWVYPTNESTNNPRTLEFDTFYANGAQQAMWGSHCSLHDTNPAGQVWYVDAQDGESPAWIPVKEAKTGNYIPCNLTPNQWHHITWQVHLDLSATGGGKTGQMYYDYLIVDGTSYNLDYTTKVHPLADSTYTRLGIQAQQDLNDPASGVSSITEYLGAMSFTYW